MDKAFILFGYSLFLLYTLLSGNIDKYMNTKYVVFIYFATVILGVLSFFQFLKVKRKKIHNEKKQSYHPNLNGFLKFLFIIPLVTGFCLPIATLDSNSVWAKGINFPVMNGVGHWGRFNQILQPNSSFFLTSDEYKNNMNSNLSSFENSNNIFLNNTNYLNALETIYKFNSDLIGKQIEFDGFAFTDKSIASNQVFFLRFGILHCLIDAGVYGLLTELPANGTVSINNWYHVKGTIEKTYYPSLQAEIPYIKIDTFTKITPPKEPYVYIQMSMFNS